MEPRRTRARPGRLAYAAAAWAFAFAAVGVYWAAGGTAGIETIGGEPERLGRARDPGFVATLWLVAVLKLAAGLAALALGRVPRLGLLLGAGGLLLALYETAELVQHLLMAVGAIGRGGLDDAALYGHLAIWDPWWILGGCLFALAGRAARRRR